MAEVQEIEDELREKHRESGKYKLRSWAHLIQLKKHSSMDEPPDKPFVTQVGKYLSSVPGKESKHAWSVCQPVAEVTPAV